MTYPLLLEDLLIKMLVVLNGPNVKINSLTIISSLLDKFSKDHTMTRYLVQLLLGTGEALAESLRFLLWHNEFWLFHILFHVI